MIIPGTPKSNACDSCAFREGSETFDREPYNRFRGQICALSGVPFFCHHGLNWHKPIAIRKGIATDVDGNRQRLKVCQGWRAQGVKDVPAGPKHAVKRMIRRALGQDCLDTLECAISESDPAEHAELWAHLRAQFKKLLKASGLEIVRKRKVKA